MSAGSEGSSPSDDLAAALRAGDRRAIARSISLVEAGGPDADALGAALYPDSGRAYSVGITGAPGSGKSTLTDGIIAEIRAGQETVGVLAIDPSSPFTGGAILGDRVRMQAHDADDGVFVRSMATRGHLGGLALSTPQAARVLDVAGWHWIVIETVGVGQVEVDVMGTADITVVVLNPGWGDGVQAVKAGLLEIADVFIVNKADRPGLEDTVREIEATIDLAGGAGRSRVRPAVIPTVATTGDGVAEAWSAVVAHRHQLEASGELARRRRLRLADEIRRTVASRLAVRADAYCSGPGFEALLEAVALRRMDPGAAAEDLLSRGDH